MPKLIKVLITCSNCGKNVRISNTIEETAKIITDGWRSCGSALYCPECIASWQERNGDRQYNDQTQTFWTIAEHIRRQLNSEEP